MTTRAREVEAWLREEADAQEVCCRTPAKQIIPKLREAASALSALIAECEWLPIETFKHERGQHYIFWEPECQNGQTTLPARVNTGFGYTRKPTHWRLVSPPQPVPVGEET